jgi:signal transduction histidine kinase/ActR/RegA family two-component response regulator
MGSVACQLGQLRHGGVLGALRWLFLLLLLAAGAAMAQDDLAAEDSDSELPRHPLETRALSEPDLVLKLIPQALNEAAMKGDGRELALLHLANANACRMVADWPCQRGAGVRAREHAEVSGDQVLAIRGLIAEARASISLQDYSRAERILGDIAVRLQRTQSPELAADMALAYSALGHVLGKHQLALEYANRGLAELAPGKSLSMRVRLLRNRARAMSQLGEMQAARGTLEEAMRVAEAVRDPKLRAELHLEAADMARASGDRAAVQRNTERVLGLALDLKNSQLAAHARELLGLTALDAGDREAAERELQAASQLFASLGLARDELRVSRGLISVRLKFAPDAPGWSVLVERMLELEAMVAKSDRAMASDDFDARLLYAEQALDLVRLESEATLAREREQALAERNQLTVFLVLLSVAMVIVMAVFFSAQRRSNRQLRAALDARLRALTQTSHELRNPIGGVLGLSELLLRSTITPAQRSMIEAIRSAGATIEKLAQDLLDRGRIESGRLSLSLHPTALRLLAESVYQLHLPRAREKGLQLLLESRSDLPESVMLDAERLQQVLSNLIGNSLKFTDRGEIQFSIRARARSNDGRVRVAFAVRDTGPGIDKDEIGSLFEPFAKGRAGQRHRAGAGLGLSISADLVRLMGGELVVDSTPGQGCEFRFELTLEVCAVEAAGAGAPVAAHGAGLRVLLVDDDEDVTLALRSQLEVLGCKVESAGSSLEARALVAARHFDLLLLDVELPDGQGPELARILRSGERNMQNSRVAIVSGHQAPSSLPIGVDEWLTKPVLLDRLNMLLAGTRSSAALDRAA